MQTLLLTLLLLLIAMLLMGFRVLFVKGGKFPSGHAHEVMKKAKKQFKHTDIPRKR